MELRHLRYFVAVAEELHFTRAAERLGIKQPPLSAQIRQLEAELGATLFRRLTRGIELTPAGAAFLVEARQILEQVGRAKSSAVRRARGESGQIYIGFAGGTYFHPLVVDIIREFRTKYPDVSLLPTQGSTCSLTESLTSGDIDVALIRSRKEGEPGIVVHPLAEEDLLVVLPKTHELANRRSVKLAALAKESFVLCPRKLNPTVFDSIQAACERAGFTPQLGPEAGDLVSGIPLVAAGFGVSLVPAALQQVHLDGVVYLQLAGEKLFSPIKVALKRDNSSAAVRNFVQIARRLAAGRHDERAQGGSART